MTDEEFKELFRYTIDYLMDDKGVDNLAVCYSPNGFISSEEEYLSRYPGDEYVDIMGLDLYNDKPHKGDGFFQKLSSSLNVVYDIALEKNKITALTEIGYRSLETENGYFEGLAPMDNTAPEWFTQLLNAMTSTESGRRLAYMATWANFSDTQFWIPFATEDFRHEMCTDFIRFVEDSHIQMAPVFDFNDQVC